jgi:hypothetical protein
MLSGFFGPYSGQVCGLIWMVIRAYKEYLLDA